MNCENCCHLTVVDLHDTGPWSTTLKGRGAERLEKLSQRASQCWLPDEETGEGWGREKKKANHTCGGWERSVFNQTSNSTVSFNADEICKSLVREHIGLSEGNNAIVHETETVAEAVNLREIKAVTKTFFLVWFCSTKTVTKIYNCFKALEHILILPVGSCFDLLKFLDSVLDDYRYGFCLRRHSTAKMTIVTGCCALSIS